MNNNLNYPTPCGSPGQSLPNETLAYTLKNSNQQQSKFGAKDEILWNSDWDHKLGPPVNGRYPPTSSLSLSTKHVAIVGDKKPKQ